MVYIKIWVSKLYFNGTWLDMICNRGGMTVIHENLGTWTKNLPHCPLVHQKSHADCHGIEPEVPRTVCVRYVVDKVALGWGFLWVFWFPLVSVISSVLHTHSSSPIDTTQTLTGSLNNPLKKPTILILSRFFFNFMIYIIWLLVFASMCFSFHMMINSR
jgi:hypothetical protein